MHVRKGDQVVVIAGKEKGKRGRVLRLLTGAKRVVIERVNLVKRHTKPTQRNPRGGILEKEGSLEASNVALWCGKCAAPRRAHHEHNEGQKKRRVCGKCGTAGQHTDAGDPLCGAAGILSPGMATARRHRTWVDRQNGAGVHGIRTLAGH